MKHFAFLFFICPLFSSCIWVAGDGDGLDANQRSIRLKQDEMFDFVETLRKINSEKSKSVLDWLLKTADVERKQVNRFNG